MVRIYSRRRMRSPTGSLFFTFLLGGVVGFSLCYAWFSLRSEPPAAPAAPRPPVATEPEPSTAKPVPETPEEDDSTASAQPPSDVWPARYLFVAVEGHALDEAAAAVLKAVKPGGVLLRENNIKDAGQTRQLAAQIKRAVGMGAGLSDLPLIAVDHAGREKQTLGIEDAPVAAELGRKRDDAAVREFGRACAHAARARGLGVILAPVLNVYEPGSANSQVETLSFGRDQELVAALGLAFAQGVKDGGAIAVGRSYPGLGVVRNQDDRDLLVLDKEVPRLAELMYPFSEAASQAIPGILVGHVAVPKLDEDPMRPASTSPVLITRVLRDTWHYSGVVLADDVTMGAMTQSRPAEQAAVEALVAGCDAVLFLDPDPERILAVCTAIEQAVEDGVLSLERLTTKRQRLEEWQATLALSPLTEGIPEEDAIEARDEQEAEPVPETAADEEAPKEPEQKPAPEPPVEKAEPVVEEEPKVEPPVEETEPAVEKGSEEGPQPKPEEPPEGADQKEPEKSKPSAVPEEQPPVQPELPPQEEAEGQPEDATAEESRVGEPPKAPEAKPEEPLPQEDESAAPAEPPKTKTPPTQPPNTKKTRHLIEPGETLSKLAKQYGVKAADIIKWNSLRDPKIKYGFMLTIYTPLPEGEEEAKKPEDVSPEP